MSMSTTLGCQSSTLRRKDLKKSLRMHTHISKKEAHLLLYFLVHTSMNNYNMNLSCLSLMINSSTKVNQAILKSLSQYVRTYGIAKDMNSLAFPSCSL